ncbi:MAG: hypothetical protein JRN52_04375 [Nitrososphaerota archaeon]|nr:hypothetical protein [Nitrososphaerota archaeon]
MENLSLKISMFWIFVAVGTFLYLVFLISKPIAMEPTEGSFVLGTVVVLVPLAMPYLSMTLKDSINRWTNIIAAVAYTGFQSLTVKGASNRMRKIALKFGYTIKHGIAYYQC